MSELEFMFCAGCDRRIYDDEPYRRIRELPYCPQCAKDVGDTPLPAEIAEWP